MRLLKTVLVAVFSTWLSCGLTEDAVQNIEDNLTGSDDVEEPTEFGEMEGEYQEATADQMIADPLLLAANIQSAVDEASASFLDASPHDSASQPPELSLTDAGDYPQRLTRSRSCTAEDGVATVVVERSMQKRVERERPRLKFERKFSFESRVERAWSSEDADLACDESAEYVDPESFVIEDEIKVEVKFERRKHEWKRTEFANGKSRAVESFFTAKGERSTQWGDYSLGDGVVNRNLTVSLSAERTLEVAGKNGKKIGFASEIKTAEDAPLELSTEIITETQKIDERTIKSGILINRLGNGARIETSFEDVLYVSEEPCRPSSGRISGKVYKEGDETPVKSYEIAFTADSAMITFDGGEASEFVTEGCEIQDVELNEQGDITD